jgi:hypothetical protein
MAVAVKRPIVLLDAAIHAHGGLHDARLPVMSVDARHGRAAWWSVNSTGEHSSSAGSANFA